MVRARHARIATGARVSDSADEVSGVAGVVKDNMRPLACSVTDGRAVVVLDSVQRKGVATERGAVRREKRAAATVEAARKRYGGPNLPAHIEVGFEVGYYKFGL